MSYKKVVLAGHVSVQREKDGAFIPCVIGNIDYDQFLKDMEKEVKTIDDLELFK